VRELDSRTSVTCESALVRLSLTATPKILMMVVIRSTPVIGYFEADQIFMGTISSFVLSAYRRRLFSLAQEEMGSNSDETVGRADVGVIK